MFDNCYLALNVFNERENFESTYEDSKQNKSLIERQPTNICRARTYSFMAW